MMPNEPGRPLAPHVQAAIAKGQGVGVQPKVSEAASGRSMAAHVQRAIQRSMQTKVASPIGAGRPVAAHVQAVVAKGQEVGVQPKHAGQKSGRPMAAHVQAAIAVGRGVGMQPKVVGAGAASAQGPELGSEAERLGARVAQNRAIGNGRGALIQPMKRPGKTPQGRGRSRRRPEKNEYEWVRYGANQSETLHRVRQDWDERQYKSKLEKMYADTQQVRKPRSYKQEKTKQIMRWLATVLFTKYTKAVEIQCYHDEATNSIYISSNKNSENNKIDRDKSQLVQILRDSKPESHRQIRHKQKLFSTEHQTINQRKIFLYIERGNIKVPMERYGSDLHAERRIRNALGKDLDPSCLGGVKRPCLTCNYELDLDAKPGPIWPSKSALGGLDQPDICARAEEDGILTYVTDISGGRLTMTHGSESDSDLIRDSSPDEDDNASDSPSPQNQRRGRPDRARRRLKRRPPPRRRRSRSDSD